MDISVLDLLILCLKVKGNLTDFRQTGDSRYIYRNELDKACFQYQKAYEDFKDLAKRTAADKVLRDNAFNIVKDPKYNGYQRRLASIVYKFFDIEKCWQWCHYAVE